MVEKKKSKASVSRILTSDDVIQAKIEQKEIKEQKAKKAEERKLRVEQKKLAKLAKQKNENVLVAKNSKK